MAKKNAAKEKDDKIKDRLKLLRKWDKAAIRASIELCNVFPESDPQDPDDLMDQKEFEIEGTTFRGKMTEEQFDVLSDAAGTKDEFLTALAQVMLGFDAKLVHALQDIADGLLAKDVVAVGARASAATAVGGTTPPTVAIGCCTYDGGLKKDTSKALCDGLGGDWVDVLCSRKNPEHDEA